MKTIKSYLNTLKEPYKTKALNNTSDKVLKEKANNLSNALFRAFIFSNTLEGVDYWWDLMLSLENIEEI